MKILLTLLVLLLVGVSGNVFALDTSDCFIIKDDAKRLTCFDEIYSSSFDKTVCVKTDAQIRNGIIYLPNKTKPFTGNNLCEYGNGQFKSKGKFKDGRQDGKWTVWYANGKIKQEATFKDGKCISGDC
jgi:antitoxin component YwqK of YwqJK toxin-antitoxin module